MKFAKTFTVSLVAAAALSLGTVGAQAALKSPDQVKLSLRLMMQVTNDFDRQITRKTYARLAHENMEFHDATGALSAAIADEPAAFKKKADASIQQAIKVAQKEADDGAGAAPDEAVLRKDHVVMLRAVNAVFANFPKELHPDPNVQPGGRPPQP